MCHPTLGESVSQRLRRLDVQYSMFRWSVLIIVQVPGVLLKMVMSPHTPVRLILFYFLSKHRTSIAHTDTAFSLVDI